MKTVKWVLTTILIGLVAAGGPTAWASPPEAADEADKASLEPAGPGPRRTASSATGPVRVPRGPSPQLDLDARLIGTAVVAGGPSIAFLQLANGTLFVREGEEIVAGIRLAKVWRNRVDVERAGVHQEIRTDSNEGQLHLVQPDSALEGVTQGNVDRLWETQGRTGRSLFYSHYRRPQN